MTTCRLLCALLVLALFCCSCVCTTASMKIEDTEQSDSETTELKDMEEQPGGGQDPNAGAATQQSENAVSGAGEVSEGISGQLKGPDEDIAGGGGKTADKEIKPNTTTTTTTTTKAPTTTTTTEAPSNTAMNAETSTTTTTRAPSRLREIDGSLSSSAWVCAPLLLAASALACTAVG
ncbi:mucin TcMUCII [Trypanosoma cruzi]|uniref:Mucin TcMUCII, putative n=1 Tax=Trypanosoma cruzi (strain CL Brener) TaxID=353153 RepID=Q4E1J5_TRYCC|nr:mucin TcMUCII, putative [Trypanosoma cruzi]EAN98644.1 mucin TcMUCII, putative [Trypanosoma cruzi]RNC56259.1 mucin TcMUCII [Trypanosoma cruzi]|eukprot:XP_820495.1 mucin TcMUCII [Trypanosoma cruzi strain CL Brener]